jgi:uncharacterized protein YbbK (DUF523 family)
MKPPILVSACLVDTACRYDGRALHSEKLAAFFEAGRLLPLCPEVSGGLGVPREAAAIVGGSGEDVLAGSARVITRSGRDVTAEFVRGAHTVLELAKAQGVRLAVLKSRSPSCGVGRIYSAEHELHAGMGVLAALLRRNGIETVNEEEWDMTKTR